MSIGRRSVVHVLMAAVLGGNLVSLLVNRQLWPYSQYAMFANVRGAGPRPYTTLALVGEPAEGEEFWFESQGYLGGAISPMIVSSVFAAAHARGLSRIQTRLRETYDFYERLRSRGLTDAPPLTRLHLYSFTWTLRRDLANVRTPTRRLIATYDPGDRAGR